MLKDEENFFEYAAVIINLCLFIIPRSNEHVRCTVKDTTTANSFRMTANELFDLFVVLASQRF